MREPQPNGTGHPSFARRPVSQGEMEMDMKSVVVAGSDNTEQTNAKRSHE
jgi:hypothetical protein